MHKTVNPGLSNRHSSIFCPAVSGRRTNRLPLCFIFSRNACFGAFRRFLIHTAHAAHVG